jgi:hypothetical protein
MEPDSETLVDGLRSYGVRYLSGGAPLPLSGTPDPSALIAGLAQSHEPLLRQALAALFLVHPEIAPLAEQTASSLQSPAREALIEAYVAAVYLQTLWRTRLKRHLGDQPPLPPLWLEELGLPPPAEHSGRLGLAALAARRKGGGFERVAGHLFGQLLAGRGHATAAA